MKFFLFAGLLFLATALSAQAQEDCHDVVFLKDGSVFRGRVSFYQLDGELRMTTWSGAEMQLPARNVRKVVQKCRRDRVRDYSFRETGWYHATRAFILPGQSGLGFGLQHSSGLKLHRLLGVGIGIGVETFTPQENDIVTYPLFAEARGYVLPKNVTPYYALGAGWGFAGRKHLDGSTDEWRGGWMAFGQLGYRFGNHLSAHLGLRFQAKTRTWQSWWFTEGFDKLLQKRLELGVGIML